MSDKRSVSIRQRLGLALVAVLVFEIIIYTLMLIFSGTFGVISGNAYEDLSNTAALRSTAAQESLNSVSDILINNYEKFNNIAMEYANGEETDYTGMFVKMLPLTELFSGNDMISGVFVFGSVDTSLDRIPAIYLSNVGRNVNNQRLSFKIADEDVIAQSNGMMKATSWSRTFNAKESASLDFIEEPARLAQEHPDEDYSMLGYWSGAYDLNFDKEYSIAYCLPLRDKDGGCVGVVGVQVSLNKLKDCLPYLELNSHGAGNYCMVRAEKDATEAFRKVVVSGESFNRINNYSDTVTLDHGTGYEDIYTLAAESIRGEAVYTAINPLELTGNSPYSNDIWMLFGIVDGAYLDLPATGIKLDIFFIFMVTMLLGLFFGVAATGIISYPIHRFITELKRVSPLNPELPATTSVDELNELGYIVSKAMEEINAFSSKMNDIVDMTGFSFGAFEYSRGRDMVVCTDMVLELLQIEREGHPLFLPRNLFEERMEAFTVNLTPGIDQVYKISLPGGTIKYIRLKTVLSRGKILGIMIDTTNDTIRESTMKHIKDHDALTNLLNRSAFRRVLADKFSSAKITRAVLIHCDIDSMSDINSRYGNVVGDRCLSTLGTTFKKYHDRITCFAARTAGDEFKMLMLGYDKDVMAKKLQRLFKELLDTQLQTSQGTLSLHVSIGAAWYPEDCDNPNTLEQYAEFAMYQAKRNGKNLYRFFDQADFEAAEQSFKTGKNIEMLINEGMVRYAFQPIVSTLNGEIYGYEALMRPGSDNTISPHDVIVFATEQGKLGAIEKLTWFNALDDFSMQGEWTYDRKIFINSIPNEILSEKEIRELEEEYSEYLGSIVLEIIENEQSDSTVLRRKKDFVEKWGCLLAMDDYGSGYSNDNTLLSLKPDIIKLDIEMITGIEEDPDRQTLVKNIISYAHQRGVMVLAEGIERSEQLKTLIDYGVDLLQGFYLAKPNFDAAQEIDEAKRDEIIRYRNERYS